MDVNEFHLFGNFIKMFKMNTVSYNYKLNVIRYKISLFL